MFSKYLNQIINITIMRLNICLSSKVFMYVLPMTPTDQASFCNNSVCEWINQVWTAGRGSIVQKCPAQKIVFPNILVWNILSPENSLPKYISVKYPQPRKWCSQIYQCGLSPSKITPGTGPNHTSTWSSDKIFRQISYISNPQTNSRNKLGMQKTSLMQKLSLKKHWQGTGFYWF